MNDNAITKDYILKWLSLFTNAIVAGRKSKDAEQSETLVKKVHVKHEKLFSLFETIYPYAANKFPNFLLNFLNELDGLEEIEKVSSVSNYNSEIKSYHYAYEDGEEAIEKNSYSLLTKVTLLEHYTNITKLIINDYGDAKNVAIDKASLPLILLLTLIHDIGKIKSLCERYSIDIKKSHEERSYIFLELFLENQNYAEKYSEGERDVLKILLENMHSLSKGEYNNNAILKLFVSYDCKSRREEVLSKISN